MEKAKQAVLQQTVKSREDVATIRLGRDGFEKVEDVREKEMRMLQQQEETARTRAEDEAKRKAEMDAAKQERRESMDATGESPRPPSVSRMESDLHAHTTRTDRSPSVTQKPFAPRRSESMDTTSPLNSVKSAWTGGAKADESVPMTFGFEEQILDLSDLAPEPQAEEIGDAVMIGDSPAKAAPAAPVWTGPVIFLQTIFDPQLICSSTTPPNLHRRPQQLKPVP